MSNVKPISQMSFNELANYVPSLPGWDWRLANGSRPMRGFGGRIIAEPDARIIDEENEADHEHIEDLNLTHGDVYGVILAYQGGHEYYDDQGIDIRDSATKGCIMAMIRERHGEGCYVKYDLECGWAVFDREGGLIAGHGGQSWSKDEIFTEEEYAMVAALAADENIIQQEPGVYPDVEPASDEDIVATFEATCPESELSLLNEMTHLRFSAPIRDSSEVIARGFDESVLKSCTVKMDYHKHLVLTINLATGEVTPPLSDTLISIRCKEMATYYFLCGDREIAMLERQYVPDCLQVKEDTFGDAISLNILNGKVVGWPTGSKDNLLEEIRRMEEPKITFATEKIRQAEDFLRTQGRIPSVVVKDVRPEANVPRLDLSDLRRKRIEFHKKATKVKEANFVDSTKEALMWQQATNLELAMTIERLCSILGIKVTYGEKDEMV